MNIDCIIQARLGSTRLPGKVLLEIEGRSLIEHCLTQVKYSKLVNRIIVACTVNPNDKRLIDKVKELGYKVFIGNEDDVLDRYYQAAKEYKTDVIVRVTSDCPLIDPEVLDKVVKAYLEDPCDYCSNIQPPTYPDGHDVEVIPFTALERAWNDASLMSEREHVTVHLWKNPDKFKLVNIENDEDFSDLRLSVDEKEDFILIEKIIQKINKSPIFLRDIIELFKNEPDLPKINSTFMRNEGQAKSFREDRIVR